ncbi:hypothetical protein [Streptomyces sp. NPDC003719]
MVGDDVRTRFLSADGVGRYEVEGDGDVRGHVLLTADHLAPADQVAGGRDVLGGSVELSGRHRRWPTV